jgi:transposase
MEIFAYYKIKCGKWDLGIVAGIIDEMELVEEVNKMVGIKTRENLTSGQVVKAMILNGLGFLSAPLYLFGEFFVGKPTEHLIGEGVLASHLNVGVQGFNTPPGVGRVEMR